LNARVGYTTGDPGVFLPNPYPYPQIPIPVSTGTGFDGYGGGSHAGSWGNGFLRDEASVLTSWRGGRGRSGLVSLETWHVTNEDLLAGGEEEVGAGW
jgi:hypothetical protein